MTPMDIDALLRETEATLFSLTHTTTEETQETLEDDLESMVVFQQECERLLGDLTEEKVAVREDRGGEEEGGMTQGEEVRPGVKERRRGGDEEAERKGRGCNGRRRGAEEDCQERTGGGRDEVREEVVDIEGRKEGGAQGQEDHGEGEKKGRTDIKEKEVEEEMKLAQKSLLEVANDLTELQPQRSERRSVRPKSKLSPRKSTDSQNSNTTADPFGNGQPVAEKPRPLLSPRYSLNFTMDNLQQELTYLLDMFLQDPEKSGDDADFTETTTKTTTTTTPTATDITTTAITPTTTDINTTVTTSTVTNITTKATTTATDITTTTTIPPATNITTTATTSTATNTTTISNTNTASPPASPPETITSYPSTTTINTTSNTTPPPLSTTSMDSHAFIYPPSPSPSLPPSPHTEKSYHHQQQEERHFSFSSLVGGVKNLGWRNSLKRKKKRNLVISDPQNFRQLKATTSIKPNEDPFMLMIFSGTGNGTPGENGTWNGAARQGMENGMVE